MSKVADAVTRLEGAIEALQARLAARDAGEGDATADLIAERDELKRRVAVLEAQAAEDAALRAEAAAAVKAALGDLKAIASSQNAVAGDQSHG